MWPRSPHAPRRASSAPSRCVPKVRTPTSTCDSTAPMSRIESLPGRGLPSASVIVYFGPNFRFPENVKVSLCAGRVLPWDMVGTFDFLYTKSINQFYISDVNLQGVVGDWSGEGGRPLYGTIAAGTGTAGSASATPTRLTSSFRDVLRHENRSADRSFSVTGQFPKRFSDRVEVDVGCTYFNTQGPFSLTPTITRTNSPRT